MTDKQKALDLVIHRNNDSPLTLQEFEILKQVKAALEAKAVPDGYVLAPIEPTDEMLHAVVKHYMTEPEDKRGAMTGAYKAMIKAAQEGGE